jgi:hypothetical protein
MAIQTETIDIASRSGFISHALTRPQPDSTRLMLMLPGRAYTCDFPALYYVRRVGQQNGFDVLSMRYGSTISTDNSGDDMGAALENVISASQKAIALGQGRYKQVCIVAKSIGTLFAPEVYLAVASALPQARIGLMLLTPLPPSIQRYKGAKVMSIIGTQDPVWSPELKNTADDEGIEMNVLEKLDHGFEVADDWLTSIRALEIVARTCERFLQATFA